MLDRSQAKPLHAVIRRGDARLVDYLLQAGADVNCTDGKLAGDVSLPPPRPLPAPLCVAHLLVH